jgi:conflict system STAND superfamily ATPase
MSTADVLVPERPRIARKKRPSPPAPLRPDSPYKGLSYYREEDAPFFFGREQETKVVAANAMASRLTVLYGESGVGKSSLLRAGATRYLMDIARENVERRGTPRLLVAVFPSDEEGRRTTWRDDPIEGITSAIQQAVASLGLEVAPPEPGATFCEMLAAWTEQLHSDVLLILDQFEEYLLYHGREDGDGTLAAELPRAIAQPNLRVNFVISIREDMLARLDAFKRRIPTIFDNSVRVSHLDRRDARDAIEKPIDTYNEALGPAERIMIEPPLVDALLDQLEAGRVVVGFAGVGTSDEEQYGDERPIETPYLQLVMTRLWAEELGASSRVIRLTTLERLGNSERIVKSHLDAMMRTLPRYARYVAARVFHHLVTPSGSKIAHTAKDVADYAAVPEFDVAPVLDRLTQPQYRILRCVARSAADEGPARYEIFHDVLAAPILDWRSRYLRTRRVTRLARNWITAIAQILLGLLCGSLLVAYALTASPKALLTVWFAGATFVWFVSTIVLVKRWRRRDAWAVPLVGLATAFCGIVTGPLSLIIHAVRLVSWASHRLRAGARARLHAARGRVEVALGSMARLHRFSGLISILGAGVIVLGCLLPAIEWYDDNDVRHTAALLGSGHRLAYALLPLACVAMGVVVGLGAILRPRPRQFVPGVALGLGVGAMTYFFSLIFWPDALGHLLGVDVFGTGALGAPALAMAGAGLTLVSAAPTYGVEIFASILGARRALVGSAASEMPLDLDRTSWRVKTPIAILGLLAAAIAFAAAFATSGAWERPDAQSLFAVSFWAGLQVVVPAAAAAFAAAVILLGRRISLRGAGCLSGSGVALLALFVGIIAVAGGHASGGAYLGAVMGALLIVVGLVAASAVRSGGGARKSA